MKSLRTIQPLMNALAVFESAGRLGSFTKTAEEMGTSQPAVSRHISNLEAHLGAGLFVRHHNKIVLSEAGETLHNAVSLGLWHVQSVFEDLRRASNPRAFTLGCSYELAHLFVIPRLVRQQERLADWDIRMMTSDSYLDYESPDVACSIRFGTGHWPDLVAVPLFPERVVPVCTPDFLNRHPDLEARPDGGGLRDVPLLHLDEGGQGWLTWDAWFSDCGLDTPRPRHGASPRFFRLYPFLIQAALDGQGVALGWRSMIDSYLDEGRLVPAGPEVATGRGYYLVADQAVADSQVFRALAAVLAADAG